MTLPFSKEVIAEAIKAVLAEGSKTVIVGNPSQTAQDIMNDPDVESTAKKTAVDTIKKGMRGDKVEVPTKSMEEDHHLDPNDESDMAKVQLINICKYSQELIDMIPDGTQLDAWVQDKLSIAFDYIDTVKHYLEGEEYLASTDAPAEEELGEDYEPRTKEDLVFQYLRDAWQFGAMKGKDVNPDEELSAMADSLLTYLPDYDSAELEEATKEEFKAKKKGQTITYNGQDYVVDSNDGIVITAKGEDGKVKHINLGMAKSGMNEEDFDDAEVPADGFEDDAAKAPKGDKKLNKAASKNDKVITAFKKLQPLFKKAAAGDKEALDILKANQDVVLAYKKLMQI